MVFALVLQFSDMGTQLGHYSIVRVAVLNNGAQSMKSHLKLWSVLLSFSSQTRALCFVLILLKKKDKKRKEKGKKTERKSKENGKKTERKRKEKGKKEERKG